MLLTGCTLLTGTDGTLTLTVPESGYPPFEATLTAGGVPDGMYTFDVEGNTYTQYENVLTVIIDSLPCVVKVTWVGSGVPQTAEETIWLRNASPVIGRPVLNGITNLWTIHPRSRYIVTFPNVHDPENGDVTLVDVTVYHTGQDAYNAVFCPPYTGLTPPKIDLYRVRTNAGDILNSFIFFSTWEEKTQPASVNNYKEWKSGKTYAIGDRVQYSSKGYLCRKATSSTINPDGNLKYWTPLGDVVVGSNLPYSPPDQAIDGYPGSGTTCLPWPTVFISPGMTVITSVWEDEQGDRTTRVDEIPTMVYPGC